MIGDARGTDGGARLGMFLVTVNFMVRWNLDLIYCRSNLPEVRDDADRIDRSAVDRVASRHQNGKTTNQKDGSDDESRHSNMEFSTG